MLSDTALSAADDPLASEVAAAGNDRVLHLSAGVLGFAHGQVWTYIGAGYPIPAL